MLRKSDTLTGASRNHLENLKAYLKNNNQVRFSNAEIRRNLRVKETTLRRYNNQLLSESYIKKVKIKESKSYWYEITDIEEYKNLKTLIDTALQDCITQIQPTTSPPTNHTQKAKTIKTKPST